MFLSHTRGENKALPKGKQRNKTNTKVLLIKMHYLCVWNKGGFSKCVFPDELRK